LHERIAKAKDRMVNDDERILTLFGIKPFPPLLMTPGSHAVALADKQNHDRIFQRLLSRNSVDERDRHQMTMLMVAILVQESKAIRALLEIGADPDASD